MKQLCFAALALCLLTIAETSLYSQTGQRNSDTTWVYQFSSETDSAFSELKLYSLYDSASFEETVLMRTDVQDGTWHLGTKFHRHFNAKGLLRTLLRYTWDAALEQWDESFLYEYYYDAFENDTLNTGFYKYGSDEWISSQATRFENTYNDAEQLIQVISLKGYPGDWNEFEKFEYTYDDAGMRVLTIRYNFGMDWALNARYETSYDDQGRKVEEITYNRMGEQWEKGLKTAWVYDASGNETMIEVTGWDSGNEQWNLISREEIAFDPMGKAIWKLSTELEAYGEPLVTTMYEYFYNLSGKLETTVISVLDEGSGEYVLTHKEFTRHGGDYFVLCDSMCSGQAYAWEGETIQAGGTYRKEYVSVMGLDSIYTLYLVENPVPAAFVVSGPSAVALDQETLYIAEGNEAVEYSWEVEKGTVLSGADNDSLLVRWENSGTGEVSSRALNESGCSSDTISLQVIVGGTGLKEPVNGRTLLFPVPVRDQLWIESEVALGLVELLDLNGRIILSTGWKETSVDLSSLGSGIYMIHLRDPEGKLIETHKIIKE